MGRTRIGISTAAVAALALLAAGQACLAEDHLKIAVGGRGIGETFVTEVGYKAGMFKKQNLVLDIFYTDGLERVRPYFVKYAAFQGASHCGHEVSSWTVEA